jgi:histidinol-phosphate aminotransferase
MTTPPFTPLVAGLPATVPFVGPETLERRRGRPFAARLGANESGFGPSPRAVEAMRAAAPEMWRYCDAPSHELRRALAERHGIAPERIAIGEGIDGLLGNAVRLFVEEGTPVVTSDGAYPTFNYHVTGHGGRLVRVPYLHDHEDPAGLADAVRETGARMVYFCNPDNPMGTRHAAGRALALLDALPEDCVLCLDEAYIEYAPEGTAPDWGLDDSRVIRFRTFSKAYGLAGLRIAWAVADPEVVAGFDRIRNHFGVNRMAQAAALAALGDEAHLAEVCARVEEARARIGEIAGAEGLAALPSATNFVAIDCARDGAFARAVLAALQERDVFVRMPGATPLDRCIRVSCAPEEELAAFAAALPGVLEAARAATAEAQGA